MTVVSFGPLTCSIVTTTRKFFTILGSVLLFGNVMMSLQWVGTVLVFLGEGRVLFVCVQIGLNCLSFSDIPGVSPAGLGLDAKFGKAPKKTSQ